MKLPLSVVIIAKNEEKRIKACLASVLGWVDEVIVVDDESTDQTRKIAQDLGAKVLVRRMEIEGAHRNWANSQARNKWVLSLDADERVTPELKKELFSLFSQQKLPYGAYTIPRKNFIGNYWIRWGGMYPAAQLKLLNKLEFKWEEAQVHPRAFLDGPCGHLKQPLLHYTYRDFGDFLAKLNKQTTLEAQKWIGVFKTNPKKANYKMNFIHALWRMFDRFIRTYFAKKGYRDGFIGFMLAYFSSLYQIVSFAKYWELKRKLYGKQ